MKVCSNCGEHNEDWMDLCQRCGSVITNANVDESQSTHNAYESYSYDESYNNNYYDDSESSSNKKVIANMDLKIVLVILLIILLILIIYTLTII